MVQLVKAIGIVTPPGADAVVVTVRIKSVSFVRRLRPYLLKVGRGGGSDRKDVTPRIAGGAMLVFENPSGSGATFVVFFKDGSQGFEIPPHKFRLAIHF